MSALQTSVSKVRLTHWICLLGFYLEKEGVCGEGARGESWSLPVASTSYMTLQHFSSSAHTSSLEYKGKGIPRENKKENLSK